MMAPGKALCTAALAAFLALGGLPSAAVAQTVGQSLQETCGKLGIIDGCDVINEAAKMLHPSYEVKDPKIGEQALIDLGYFARYVPTKAGSLQARINVFLAAQKGSNRIYIILTGTQSSRDWLENAKYHAFTATYKDGEFYTPPGHAGFRRGMLSIVNGGLFKINEYDDSGINCSALPNSASLISHFICDSGVQDGKGKPINTIIVGHSRGSAIGQIIVPIVDGFEFKSLSDGTVKVGRQNHWPLRLQALIGFAPPYAVYAKTDREVGLKVPAGVPDQWQFLKDQGYFNKTVLFIDDRDAVPLASLGHGRHFGYRYRITGYGAVLFDGQCWGPVVSTVGAHSHLGYAEAVLAQKPAVEHCD